MAHVTNNAPHPSYYRENKSNMKKILLVLLCALAFQTCFAQRINGLFEEFKHEKNADYVTVSPFLMTIGKWFIQMDQGNDPDGLVAKSFIKGTKSIRVLDLGDCAEDVKSRFQESLKKVHTNGYEEMVRAKDDGEDVRILAKMDKKFIKDVIIAVSGHDDCSLIQLSGKFLLDDVMNIIKEENKD